MNWVAQVGHVAAKDARHARWMLLVYAALLVTAVVSIASGRAFGPYWISTNTQVLGMRDVFVTYTPLLTVIIGLIGAVWLLQDDSPTSANAFWASHPLSASAVMMAKLTMVTLAIIAVPLIGAWVALTALKVDAHTAATMLAGCMLSYGQLALAVMLIGALTDDLRTFAGIFAALLIALIVISGAVEEYSPHLGGAVAPAAVSLVSVVAGLALMVVLYRARQRSARTWLAAAFVAGGLTISSFVNPLLSPHPVPPVASGAPIAIDATSAGIANGAPQWSVRVRMAQATDSERFDFTPDSIGFVRDDGSTVRANGDYPTIVARGGAPRLDIPVRWIDMANWSDGFTTQPHVTPGFVAASVRAIVAAGAVTVSRSRVIGSLPLRSGAATTAAGHRVAIYGFEQNATGADVWIELSSVSQAGAVSSAGAGTGLGARGGVQFAIVNDARHEAMLLWGSNDSGGGGPIVLPWIGVTTNFTQFTTNRRGNAATSAPVDSAWYANARLVAVEWTATARYRASARADVR